MSTKETAYSARVFEVLEAMALQFPSISVTMEIWRPASVNKGGDLYADQQVEVWVRLGEDVPAFYIEKLERWFDSVLGIVHQDAHRVILPEGYDLRGDDHIILHGDAWLITQSAEQAGVAQLMIDKAKSRFVRPPRTDPTYRQMTMRARIA